MDKPFSFKDHFRISNDLYNGLFYYKDGQVYMMDESIDTDALAYNVSSDYSSVRFVGTRFDLELPFTLDTFGYLYMHYDFKLSLQSCLALYNHNIQIAYINNLDFKGRVGETFQTYTFYERDVITRRATLENIINY